MYKPNDKIFRLIGIPVIAMIFVFLLHKENFKEGNIPFAQIFYSLSYTTVVWEGNRAIILWLRKKYSAVNLTKKRLTFLAVYSSSFTFIITIILENILALLPGRLPCTLDSIWQEFLGNMAPTLFILTLYESDYFFHEWKKNFLKSEALEKASLKTQLEVLKSQLDPHFLFNSMNTLASLIEDENSPALTYLEQLSDVYRYVLINKDKETIPLEEEIAFAKSYIFLNKKRFRDNLIVHIDIKEEHYQNEIAPLSLQILIENAIKHNVISKDHPLNIHLYTDENKCIIVQNNLQKKNVFEKSTKTGLNNIINRYALLSSKKINVIQNKNIFSVHLPLIQSL